MQLVFSCPKCSSEAKIVLDEAEVESVKKAIVEEGRSPTLLSKCNNGHDLIVTLYFRDDELGIRDVAMPLDPGKDDEKPSEFDWVKRTFGG